MRVCIIPARSGSKRIPGKNVRLFRGRPIITWPIERVLKSDMFDRIIVSTDCPKISEIAISAGAEVPFLRNSRLSGDYVPTVDVIADTLCQLQQKKIFEYLLNFLYLLLKS